MTESTTFAFTSATRATPTGRREIRKWARSAIWLVGFAAYTTWATRNGFVEFQPDVWVEAYKQIADNNPGSQVARCATTAGAAIWAFIAATSLVFIVRRRPWRPHSGGLHLWSPVWDLPKPRRYTIPAPYFPPIDDHTQQLPDTVETDSLQAPAPEPAASPAPDEYDDAGDQTTTAAPDTTADHDHLLALANELKARCDRVFNLYSNNSPMRKARQSLLAVLIAAGANRAKTDEVAGILRTTPENARSLLRRAEKDGWVVRESPADWAIAPGVKTDYGLIVEAVDDNDETAAAAIAASIGPPLVAVTDEWLDQLIADPTPRKELRLAAANILNTAAEQWPDNPAWLQATDRLYEDQ